MASNSLLVRSIPEDIRIWIESQCNKRRITQQELLLSLLERASRNNLEQPRLFDEPYIKASLEPSSEEIFPFSFIDLFAGIGGIRLGLEAVGGRCVFSSEWDKYCQKTYHAWFNEMPLGDINKVEPQDIPDHDLLAAGFPCQPFSIAGVSKKNALGKTHGFKDDKQGNLFFVLAKIIKVKRPPIILLENVKNLKSHDKGRTWDVIHSTLDELEYSIFHKIINASSWVPQNRERIFIVGFDRKVFGNSPPFTFPEGLNGSIPRIKDILEDNPEPKYTLSDHLWQYLQDYARKHHEKGNGFGFGLVDMDGISRTLSARYYKDGSEVLIPQKGENPRRLTPREAARLMGFPDLPIVVSDTQAYRQFGNAVVPRVVEAVSRQIIKVMDWHINENLGGCILKSQSCDGQGTIIRGATDAVASM